MPPCQYVDCMIDTTAEIDSQSKVKFINELMKNQKHIFFHGRKISRQPCVPWPEKIANTKGSAYYLFQKLQRLGTACLLALTKKWIHHVLEWGFWRGGRGCHAEFRRAAWFNVTRFSNETALNDEERRVIGNFARPSRVTMRWNLPLSLSNPCEYFYFCSQLAIWTTVDGKRSKLRVGGKKTYWRSWKSLYSRNLPAGSSLRVNM